MKWLSVVLTTCLVTFIAGCNPEKPITVEEVRIGIEAHLDSISEKTRFIAVMDQAIADTQAQLEKEGLSDVQRRGLESDIRSMKLNKIEARAWLEEARAIRKRKFDFADDQVDKVIPLIRQQMGLPPFPVSSSSL